MATIHKWAAYGAYTDACAAQALKNMANAATVLSNEIDNTAALATHMDLELLFRMASAPTAGLSFIIYLVPALDGTNYADGSAGAPGVIPLVGVVAAFPSRNVTTQQRAVVHFIQIPPCKFKLLIQNSTGQATTNTDNENILSYRLYTMQSV